MPVLEKKDVEDYIQELSREYTVIAPSVYDAGIHYRQYTGDLPVKLDYDYTCESPKQILLPHDERILEFDEDSAGTSVYNNKYVLFGAQLYDVAAIKRLDRIFTDHHEDNHYQRRRDSLNIIAIENREAPDSFYEQLSLDVDDGYDVLLTDQGDCYGVTVSSEKGRKITKSQHISDGKAKPKKKMGRGKPLDLERIKSFLDLGPDQPLWHELAEDCFACGSCAYVCPICHCFDMQDRVNLDGKTGYRSRHWDSCMLHDFAAVAGEGNFRPARHERIHNWYHHKFSRAIEERGVPDCVGCGRCITVCPAKIPIYDVLKECESNG